MKSGSRVPITTIAGTRLRGTSAAVSALRDFFTTDYGLLSAAVIAFTLGMGAFYVNYFVKHIREDEARARAAGLIK